MEDIQVFANETFRDDPSVQFDWVAGPSKPSLAYRNCRFERTVSIDDFSKVRGLEFTECIFEKDVSIREVAQSIDFGGSVFHKNLRLDYSPNGAILELSNLNIEGVLSISGGTSYRGVPLSLSNINQSGNKRVGDLIFSGAFIEKISTQNIHLNSIEFREGTFIKYEATLRINTNKFAINVAKVGHILELLSSHVSHFSIDNVEKESFGRHLRLGEQCVIDEILIPLDQVNKVHIADSIIKHLRISGINEKGNIVNIQNVHLGELIFEEVDNEGKIALRDLQIKDSGRLAILSSNLGRTDFIRCDFSKVILEFVNSKITEIFLSDSSFPRKVYTNNKIDFSQARLAFGQLHTALAKQGDTVRSLEYQAREIDAHYRVVKQRSVVISLARRTEAKIAILFNRKKGPAWISPAFRKLYLGYHDLKAEVVTLASLFSLWLNSISNKFNLSWQRGVRFSFGAGILFFYLLVISSREYKFGFGLDFDPQLITAFIKFMNPLRFFDLEYLFKDQTDPNKTFLTLSPTSYIMDFFGRIFVAYGYYQTIQAFRRWGKK